MTIDELVIDDVIVNRFFTNCRAHYAAGDGRPVEAARINFFVDVKKHYNMQTDIIPRLLAFYNQFDAWEIEAQAEPA